MESRDSPHGSSEERREEEKQTKGMKAAVMGEEKDENHNVT